MADVTHVVSWLIASYTELLRSFNFFPSVRGPGRYRHLHKPAQVRHSPPGWTSRPESISVYNRSTNTRRKLTLITVRITLTVPKTALAGVTLDASFARFKASMATFNAEMVPSHSLGRWDPAFMVETRGSGERTVQRGGRDEGLEL